MRRGTVPVLCLVQFVDVLVVTSATTAIPAILRGVSAPAAAAGPLATVYAMFFGGLLILGARLGDRFGHRRILLTGIALFGAVSLLGAASLLLGPAALPAVLASRALQGAAAAVSVPSALRLLLEAAPAGDRRRRALAGWSATGAAAGAAGFLVGGLLVQALGWPAVFWFNVPLAGALFVGVAVLVAPSRTPLEKERLDVAGASLLIAAVMALIAGAALLESPESRPAGLSVVAAGAVLGGLLALRLRTAAQPLVPRRAFVSRPLRQGTAVSFVNTATTSSSSVLATLYLQEELRIGPVATGLTLLALSVAVVLTSATTGTVFVRLAPHPLAALGLAAIAAGQFVLAATVGTWWGVLVGVAVTGGGLGLASVAATTIGTTVPDGLAGSASGILNTRAQVGTALGTATMVLVAALTGVGVAWLVTGVAAALTAAWCLLPRTRGAAGLSARGSTGR